MATSDKEIFDLQANQYEFPYHHIPYFDKDGFVSPMRFRRWGFIYLTHLKRLEQKVLGYNPESILDVGCGDGRFAGMIATKVKRTIGVDLSSQAIAFAQAFYPDVDFRAVDAADLTETFDVVISIEVLEHIPDDRVDGFIKTLNDRTNPGGRIIITVPSTNTPVHKKHHRHYTDDLLQEQVRKACPELEVESIKYVSRRFFPFRLLLALLYNNFMVLDLRPLRRFCWRYTYRFLHEAKRSNGVQIVGIFKRPLGS
ncbi:MAG: class I SAM-dependent methyltransferase [bacterium]|nr:class I SAM-dependent methyltransferase [bacterium]